MSLKILEIRVFEICKIDPVYFVSAPGLAPSLFKKGRSKIRIINRLLHAIDN